MNYKEDIEKLEKDFIYELQHIPTYLPDGKKNRRDEVKYFWDAELITWIEEGEKTYGTDEDKHIMYAAVKALDNVVRDIDDKRDRAIMLWESDWDNMKRTHTNLSHLATVYRHMLEGKYDE